MSSNLTEAHSARVSGRSRCRNVTIFRLCLWRIIEIYCSSNIFASNRRLLQGETAITVGQKRGSCQGMQWLAAGHGCTSKAGKFESLESDFFALVKISLSWLKLTLVLTHLLLCKWANISVEYETWLNSLKWLTPSSSQPLCTRQVYLTRTTNKGV